ncbi:hypothetical protein ZYGR_0AL00360 [Zygosaccharomyces rouxii]|uniref:Elongation factor 1-gamma 1 n=1 Tax=Zygosaccharomyces rouxii TaxID=4956 RepID=A0A1Q3AEY9_ZYGRO|nr:hypothetical protein ZYGR_0AL00360 [Zygosaccharomyces rouxii]
MSSSLYIIEKSPRGQLVSDLVKYLNLDVKIVTDRESDAAYKKNFPLNKIPAFIGKNGFKLTETVAVIYYLVSLANNEKLEKQLAGSSTEEKAKVLQWVAFANSDLAKSAATIMFLLLGLKPFNKKELDTSVEALEKFAQVYDARLSEYTYLATENVSLADFVSYQVWAFVFQGGVGAEFRKKHPQLVRWFNTVDAHELGQFSRKGFKPAEKALDPPVGKKKEQKKEQPKQQPAQKAPAAQQPPQEKKPKHPLEVLGKSSFPLEDWKRKYMNDDTRPTALPWFWEHYNPEEWSLWKVEYKYNDELTLTFMSNNLIGGFFTRLFASVKYMFGAMVVYGENNNNGIVGAIMVRGQDYAKAFDVAPDWESYSFTKLDASKPEDKAFVEDMWAWDKPVIVNGEPREISDGKVLK